MLRQEAGASAPAALTYLLRFLDAYDFASEGEEGVQDDDRPLISAAVLGLIFEKINGYRDGSFYTPGFITMYMCRHSLRRAVVRHFNERFGLSAADVPDLRERLDDQPKRRPEFSAAFNELRVCDPAVGSGHFLVSALNELLAIKSELALLLDDEGKRLRYTLTVARDELAITDDEDLDTLVQYRAAYHDDGGPTPTRQVSRQHTRLQSALFREKRQLIEHCLYGVDLNPNSVRICRLRLWIELLKHAYYTPESDFRELETLPNLDLNVRVGNSLIGRYALTDDLTDVFRRKDTSVAAYRRAFGQFFSARGREAKQELQDFLVRLKEQFSTAIQRYDPLLKRIARVKDDLLRVELDQKPDLFGKTQLGEEDAGARRASLQLTLDKLEGERQLREQGALYRDAFEWRFEFPEILDAAGAFRGFDVVLGNPPYIRQEELPTALKGYLKTHYDTTAGTADLYVYFYELGLRLLAPGGELSFITNNKWLRAGYGQALRRYLLRPEHQLVELLDFGDLPVFPEATTYPNILSVRRAPASPTVRVAELTALPIDPSHFADSVALAAADMPTARLSADAWSLAAADQQALLEKLRLAGKPLGEYVEGKIYYGIKTGYNEAFVIDAATREKLIAEDPKSVEIIKPFLAGRDVKRYQPIKTEKYLIFTRRGIIIKDYKSILNHLEFYREKLEPKPKNWNGEWVGRKAGTYKWYEVQDSIDYWKEFDKPKILYQEIATYQAFTYNTSGLFSNNKTFFIPDGSLFLLGVLNAAPAWFFINQVAAKLANGAIAMQTPYVNQLPIPPATPEQQAAIAGLVEQVLAAKAAAPAADTQALEQQIDAAVAALYGLTPAEVALLG